MKKSLLPKFTTLVVVVIVAVGTNWTIQHYHRPGQLDLLTAQAMDMSQMRPPVGAAPVALGTVRQGSLSDVVTYTGTIAAYNEQEISPRITGTLVSLPVYPGDPVRAGQTVAQLDTSQVAPQAAKAFEEARQARIGAEVAHLTHHLHHKAEFDQAMAQAEAAQQGVADAQSEAQADRSAIADARAGVQSAQANAAYWKTEITREKALADAGAVSQQEYQNELAQAQTAQAALAQAQAKVSQASATTAAARAKVRMAVRQVAVAQAGVRVAQADIAIARGQALQAEAGAAAAEAAARAAVVEQGYARLTSPFDGVVTARPVAPGMLVQPGTVLLKIAEISKVRLQANVAVTDLAGVHRGSPVQVSLLNGSGKTSAAHVTAIFPAASRETRTAVVEAIILNPRRTLRPGQFVTMQINKETHSDKTLVPAAAVVSEGGQSYVWTTGIGTAAAGQVYQCEKCHMHYSATDAAKNHFRDPMDGGRLVPLGGMSPTTGLTAHRIAVQTGASDGAWTEIVAGDIAPGSQVVTHGQAGLTESASVVRTIWGQSGPQTLPTAAAAGVGKTVFKCEKCGMTYSADDARRNNNIDPMDGGKLVPVTSTPPAGAMPGMKM